MNNLERRYLFEEFTHIIINNVADSNKERVLKKFFEQIILNQGE